MDEEHQAGLTQLASNRKSLFGTPSSVIKGFFQVDLRTGSGVARHSAGVDFIDDAITGPAGDEVFRPNVGVELVEGMLAGAMFILNGSPRDFAARCLLYTSPSPRDRTRSRMPSSA